MPLETITSRGCGGRRSSGRNACVTRTGPSRLTPKTGRKSAGSVSAGAARVPLTPALLTSTSSRSGARATASCAAATDASSVTSSRDDPDVGVAVARAASRRQRPRRPRSRAPSQTVQPRAARRRTVSAPRPLVAPVTSATVVCVVDALHRAPGAAGRRRTGRSWDRRSYPARCQAGAVMLEADGQPGRAGAVRSNVPRDRAVGPRTSGCRPGSADGCPGCGARRWRCWPGSASTTSSGSSRVADRSPPSRC